MTVGLCSALIRVPSTEGSIGEVAEKVRATLDGCLNGRAAARS